jgi:hypothetical protein
MASSLGDTADLDAGDVLKLFQSSRPMPPGISTTRTFDGISGPLLWSLLAACGGDAVDVIALTGVMGRLDPFVAEGCGEAAYDSWVESLWRGGWHQLPIDRLTTETMSVYREAVRELSWTVPPPVNALAESVAFTIGTDGKGELRSLDDGTDAL